MGVLGREGAEHVGPEALDPRAQVGEAFGSDRVDAPFPVAAVRDEPRVLEDPEVLRDRGLRDAQGGGQLTHRVRLPTEELHQFAPGPVPERLEGSRISHALYIRGPGPSVKKPSHDPLPRWGERVFLAPHMRDDVEGLDAELDDSWRRPPGIFVLAEVEGALGARIHEIQARVDPKLAKSLPPHITLVGSSGIGPFDAAYGAAELRERLTPICETTPPLTLPFDAPHRFPQTRIVVLPLRPHGPLRVLHDRLATCGLRSARSRHAFTPHVTLSFFKTLTRDVERELLSLRFDEPLVIGHLRCSLTDEPMPPRTLLELPLTGRHDA